MVIISPPPPKLRVIKVLHHAGDWEENKSCTENALVRTKAVTIVAGELEQGCISKRAWQCSFLADNAGLNSPQVFLLSHPESLAHVWPKSGGFSVGWGFCCSTLRWTDLSVALKLISLWAEWKLWNQSSVCWHPWGKALKHMVLGDKSELDSMSSCTTMTMGMETPWRGTGMGTQGGNLLNKLFPQM